MLDLMTLINKAYWLREQFLYAMSRTPETLRIKITAIEQQRYDDEQDIRAMLILTRTYWH